MGDSADLRTIPEAVWGRWPRMPDAVEKLCAASNWNEGDAIGWILRRLKTGEIVAAARTMARSNWGRTERTEFAAVPSDFWADITIDTLDPLWTQGDYEDLTRRRHGNEAMIVAGLFETRISPEPLVAWLNPRPIEEPPVPAAAADAIPRRELSRSEAERFSRSILTGWPESTEDFAHSKAVLFFPNHNVPRDWFLKTFRVIRGPRKRGKQPKTRD